jgi:cytochrome c biogenesis protein CcmG/thiol:disulfide interchange protein DsbE
MTEERQPNESAGEVAVARRRRPHTALIIAVVVGLVMSAFVALLATRKSAVDQQARSPLLGLTAPVIAAPDVTGSPVQLIDDLGKFVLVNFFASWCIPCQIEHPELLRWLARHTAKGDAAIIGVTFEDTAGNAKQFMQQNGGTWPVVADPDGTIALAYGVRGPPESFLINPQGIVLAKFIGRVTADGLDNVVARAEGAT